MTLPYENATSGGAALEDILKLLTRFGCSRFGTMTDAEAGELVVQFTPPMNRAPASVRFKSSALPTERKPWEQEPMQHAPLAQAFTLT